MRGRTLLALTSGLLGSVALTPATAYAAAPITCSQLATLLAANAYITQTSSDNQSKPSPTASIVAATTKNAAYCNIQFQFSSKSGPTYGYAVGESQHIDIGIGLPLNSTDGGSGGGVQGAWNGKIQNLGGGGCAGSVGATTSATNMNEVGSSTDTGHNNTAAQNGGLCNFGLIQATNQLDTGGINDFIYEGIH